MNFLEDKIRIVDLEQKEREEKKKERDKRSLLYHIPSPSLLS
jgi:hypothetical protein